MARQKQQPTAPESEAAEVPQWTHEELKRVRHLGPAIIGEEMHRAAQVFEQETKGGIFGPALLAN